MRRARWLVEWKGLERKPVFYHCISRVVERRYAFGPEEKEKFRALMRMYEKFTGCRVVSYCLMCNHIHLLLEVPPMSGEGISEEVLLKRLSAIYSEAFVAGVAKELATARELGMEQAVAEIFERFTYRMHDLGHFMKSLLQRFSQWFNRVHARTGTLWEQRFKSVIVEDGTAARAMAAYIDLNPVRAGMVKDAGDYRWSSYGEAMGGGATGNGWTARAGLVRAMLAHQGVAADASFWDKGVALDYRRILIEGSVEKVTEKVGRGGELVVKRTRKGISKEEAKSELEAASTAFGLKLGALRSRIRYFTDGAVIGSRGFVDGVFQSSRDRFGGKRKDGARRMRGEAGVLSRELWSMRDLRNGVGIPG